MAGIDVEDTQGYVEFFGSRDMATFAERLSLIIARELNPVTRARYSALLQDLFGDLHSLAARTARLADEEIQGLLDERLKRPESEGKQHLREGIHSEIYPGLGRLGGVGVVNKEDITEFDYWKVQEEGSAVTYPGFIGRKLFGSFIGGASPDAPRAEHAGSPAPPHARYVPASQARGGARGAGYPYGPGEIRHDIEPKHFIRDGAARAWTEYVRGIHSLSQRYAQRLLRIAGQQGSLRR